MKKITTLIILASIGLTSLAQAVDVDNSKRKSVANMKEMQTAVGLSDSQVTEIKKSSNKNKRTLHDNKVIIKAYEEQIKFLKQVIKTSKEEYKKTIAELLSDEQKIKYENYKKSKKENKK
tara:strand:- start:9539 stop:9898 length:360 start_codon:yes stop_codon:yes gene_type:complete